MLLSPDHSLVRASLAFSVPFSLRSSVIELFSLDHYVAAAKQDGSVDGWAARHMCEEGTMKNKGKHVQLMDSSYSDSSKNQSESWYPHYTKKRLIPDSTVISTRPASLRSAKKLIETRGTSVQAQV
ncbi:hypothetical protein JHK82_021231 [Glycine max]|nr:hypothetical protein JHK85_021685 [Glycine max]KAG5025330.1 hypothetical protein JHK86_021244 [Glycine max]KAG5136500.1 hypothetical protein JHK82_021231 [Glycine max]